MILATEIHCEGQLRSVVRYTQEVMDLERARRVPWPDAWRQRLTKAVEAHAK